jgi:hypothetical protein
MKADKKRRCHSTAELSHSHNSAYPRRPRAREHLDQYHESRLSPWLLYCRCDQLSLYPRPCDEFCLNWVIKSRTVCLFLMLNKWFDLKLFTLSLRLSFLYICVHKSSVTKMLAALISTNELCLKCRWSWRLIAIAFMLRRNPVTQKYAPYGIFLFIL